MVAVTKTKKKKKKKPVVRLWLWLLSQVVFVHHFKHLVVNIAEVWIVHCFDHSFLVFIVQSAKQIPCTSFF